jgi:adenosylcobinamide hydrolase
MGETGKRGNGETANLKGSVLCVFCLPILRFRFHLVIPMTEKVLPWTVTVRDRTLVIHLPELYRVLSWAPLNGGFCQAHSILNHQVRIDDYPTEEPALFLSKLACRLGAVEPTVGLMTGVLMDRLARHTLCAQGFLFECFATVGVSNALTVGDPAAYEEKPGTINIIVLINHPLTDAALVEAVGMATEAKSRALFEANVKSTVSEKIATGTGTDCIVVACPNGTPLLRYCGKHTLLGELLGRVTYEAVMKGLHQAGVTP